MPAELGPATDPQSQRDRTALPAASAPISIERDPLRCSESGAEAVAVERPTLAAVRFSSRNENSATWPRRADTVETLAEKENVPSLPGAPAARYRLCRPSALGARIAFVALRPLGAGRAGRAL